MQSSAPEVRDILEKGVADAVTFPWGSVLLFGIDKVTKYHMNVPLYVTTLRLGDEQGQVREHVARRRRRRSTTIAPTSGRCRLPAPGPTSSAPGVAKLTSDAGHEVYTISDAAAGRMEARRREPVVKAWADSVRKVGGDPDAV